MVPCRHLRSKGFYGFDGRSVLDWLTHQAEHRAACNCLRTNHAWGPDGQVAGPDDCTKARACYEAALGIDAGFGWTDSIIRFFRRLRG